LVAVVVLVLVVVMVVVVVVLVVKVLVKERIVLREIHLRTTGRHLSMGSHMQCYLPPDRGDCPAFTP